MNKDSSNNMGIFFFLLLGMGALFLFTRRQPTQSSYQPENYYEPEPPPIPLSSIAIRPQARITPQNSYDNEEVREITYNDDGLPTRIVIHRHAATS